ncbi:MAG: cupin domain-containing protein [Alphaproteobacteria bacterium]|nr:cupin domain-containing protein [Alphaproteobacteria bacterium]
MTLQYPLIDVADVAPLPGGKPGDSEIRQGIGTHEGSTSTAWHLTAKPGQPGLRHVHHDSDELIIHLAGTGIAGQGGQTVATRPGLCRLVPKGVSHYFVPDTTGGDGVLVGFIPSIGDLDTDFDIQGQVSLSEIGPGGTAGDITDGFAVYLEDVEPEHMEVGDGWSITDFRLPLAAHNGSASTLFRARFFPDAIHKKHRHDSCDEIYYVISGRGLAGAGDDRVEVHGGQFHYIPRGVEHWLYNLSDTVPIEVVGIYVGAGTVTATGYVYLGEVDHRDVG